jgi:hypothetical protein
LFASVIEPLKADPISLFSNPSFQGNSLAL